MRRTSVIVVAVAALTAVGTPVLPASAGTTGSISGVAFEDTNRNGVRDVGEAAFSGHVIYLFDDAGDYLRNATTDGAGRYRFGSLSAATYVVEYSSLSWSPLKREFVPTTTGSLLPKASVTAPGDHVLDFGWRPIVWSTQLGAPVSTVTAANGARVESYNDAVSAADVTAVLTDGLLLGSEGAGTTLRLGYGNLDQTVTGSVWDGRRYAGATADVYLTWDSWLSRSAFVLFHEYGHAWSHHHATTTQQDPSLAGYLRARGLEDDPRVGSAYGWMPTELVAEDYRQLFGSPTGREAPQANQELPPASDVHGLREYLRDSFTAAPTRDEPTQQVAAPRLSGVAMSPTPVKRSGTAAFTVSTAAVADVAIRTPGGSLVRQLRQDVHVPAGATAVSWDRTTASGQRAKAGSYVLVVTATNDAGVDRIEVTFSVA